MGMLHKIWNSNPLEKDQLSIDTYQSMRDEKLERLLREKFEEIQRNMLKDKEYEIEKEQELQKLTNTLFYSSYICLRSLTWEVESCKDFPKALYTHIVHEIADDFHNLPSVLDKKSWNNTMSPCLLATAIVTLHMSSSLMHIRSSDILNDVKKILPEMAEVIGNRD